MSDKSTEKKAPNTPRSTAMAALPFYENKIRTDKEYAARIVDEVFGEDLREEAYKNRLNDALDNPPHSYGSLTQRMRESEHLRSKKDDMKDLDIDNLDKMEAAVARSNRPRTQSEVGLDTADELLGLSQSSPELAMRIGDRSTPIPDFPSSVFDTPERKRTRRSKSSQIRGGMPRTQKEMKKNQAEKFHNLLLYYGSFEKADNKFKEYLKDTNQPEMFGKKLRMNMFNNIESGLAEEFDFESHPLKDNIGGRKRTRRRKQAKRKRHLKKGTRKKTK